MAIIDEYRTKEELAAELGKSPRTIERWVRLGIIPKPVRLGATPYFHVPTIQSWLAKQAQKGVA